MPDIVDKDRSRTIVIHPDGTTTPLHATEETAITKPDGSHDYTKTELRVATLDGHVLAEGGVAYVCTSCKTGPWSTNAIATCTSCKQRVCVQCTKTTPDGDQCKACAKKAKRKAFFAYLRSITD